MSPSRVRPLPYPGHTWYLSQHAVGLHPKTLYAFLQCAVPFEGEERGFGSKITQLMIQSGILTSNIRGDQPDAWRDYQQLLAELGLIVSTKISQTLILTDLAHMFLAGEIGFAELVGMQALRYQYPNGQKSTIQARLRQALTTGGIAIPATLTELQSQSQVLLKPGILILRVLIELTERGQLSSLSASECQAFLVPCKNNREWHLAVSEIIAARQTQWDVSDTYRHARRNVQDWFKLLECADFFVLNDDNEIALSSFAATHLSDLKRYCASQEDASTFWIPTDFAISGRLSWFTWFGTPPFSSQSILRRDLDTNSDYVSRNYVAGLEDDVDDQIRTGGQLSVNLRPIQLESLERVSTMRQGQSMDALLDSIRLGMQKRHAKALLHDRIVKELAEQFLSQGASVESDPDSIDLFAGWPTGESAIFEVKTVTKRSFQSRLRAALGQVEEYAYRRKCDSGLLPDRVIVVNADLEEDAWQLPFLLDYMEVGLVCRGAQGYRTAAPIGATSSRHWLSLVHF
jgi:hypothetical protein